jgi:DNA-binding response OmpR family regulator
VNGKRVLIIDDSDSIRSEVSDYLKSRGFSVSEASDGIGGLNKILSSDFDLIVLDVVMPGIDGFKLCQLIRENGINVPIIMLTKRSDLEDKVTGFRIGADDYLAKPFSVLELDMRIMAIFRRTSDTTPVPANKIKRGDIEINLDRRSVYVKGKEISLTPIEFSILKLLASFPGRVYSRRELLNLVWRTDYEGYKRNIDPHVNRLRSKIEDNPRKPRYILTVWGTGYKFNEDLE